MAIAELEDHEAMALAVAFAHLVARAPSGVLSEREILPFLKVADAARSKVAAAVGVAGPGVADDLHQKIVGAARAMNVNKMIDMNASTKGRILPWPAP